MFTILAFFALPLLTTAQFIPTAPGLGDVFKQGGPCTIQWTADTSGKWKQTFIQLMTGPNQAMVHLATLATVDGTDPTKTSIAVPCPGVSPNSAIYFYQFTAQGQNTTWTGRFAISDASGATTPPPNAKQPDGQVIPWGTGKLLDASQGSPPPPTAPSGQVDGSGSSGGAPGPAGLPAASGLPNSVPSLSATSFVAGLPSSPLSSAVATPSGFTTALPSAVTSAAEAATAAPSTTGNANGASLHHHSIVAAISAMLILAAAGLC